MARPTTYGIITKSKLTAIADAVRGLLGSATTYTPTELASELNAITPKSATTYTPGTTNQTIAAGQYLQGVQTINGDANLIAANIVKGISIFGVTGTYEGITGIDFGSFVTASSDYNSDGNLVINHNLGDTPQYAAVFTSSAAESDKKGLYGGFYSQSQQLVVGLYGNSTIYGSIKTIDNINFFTTVSSTQIVFGQKEDNWNSIPVGFTCHYVVWTVSKDGDS